MRIYQEKEEILQNFENLKVYLNDEWITPSIKRILETMRKGESAWGEINPAWFVQNDAKAVETYKLDETKTFYFEIDLIDFERIVDWY